MSTIVVLFNLKPGVHREEYERWARATDLPIVNALPSVDRFEVLRSAGLLAGGAAPYEYVELIRVNDMPSFMSDIASETIQRVASEYRQFADNPVFILTHPL